MIKWKNDKRKNNDPQNTYTETFKKTRDELMYSEKVGRSYSTNGTYRVTLVTKAVISHEWGKDEIVFIPKGTFVTQIFR